MPEPPLGSTSKSLGSSKSSSLPYEPYGCDYEWDGSQWVICMDYCSVDEFGNPMPYTCLDPPSREGDYIGEVAHVGCQ